MTTIAYDGKTVAADGQKTVGNFKTPGNSEKLIKRGSKIYAMLGTAAIAQAMIDWYEKGADPLTVPKGGGEQDGCIIVFSEGSGACEKFSSNCPYPEQMSAPDAWGSGGEYAIGAMRAGADAKTAVQIACQCDISSGGKIMWYETNWKIA